MVSVPNWVGLPNAGPHMAFAFAPGAQVRGTFPLRVRSLTWLMMSCVRGLWNLIDGLTLSRSDEYKNVTIYMVVEHSAHGSNTQKGEGSRASYFEFELRFLLELLPLLLLLLVVLLLLLLLLLLLFLAGGATTKLK